MSDYPNLKTMSTSDLVQLLALYIDASPKTNEADKTFIAEIKKELRSRKP